MSANINFDTALKPFVIATNVSVNTLTKLYYSCLNPQWDAIRKTGSASTFHYNVKATLYNLVTAILGYKVAKTVLGKGNLKSSIVIVPLMLYIRSVIDRSMSVQQGGTSIIGGIVHLVRNTDTLEGQSMADTAYSTICLIASQAQSLRDNTNWKQDMLVIQGFPVLKNWA